MTEDLRKLLDEAGPAMEGLHRIGADDWGVEMPGDGGWTFVGKRENHPRLIVIETGFGASADRRQDAIERLCILAPDLARKVIDLSDAMDRDADTSAARIAALEAEAASLRERVAGLPDDPEDGTEYTIPVRARWKACLHGGGWWIAKDYDGREVTVAALSKEGA